MSDRLSIESLRSLTSVAFARAWTDFGPGGGPGLDRVVKVLKAL